MAKARERTQRRHVREKATIDHLVQDVYEPKMPDEKHTERSPTTSTGLPVEDQVRKEWDPRKGGFLIRAILAASIGPLGASPPMKSALPASVSG
jgi:hypothetical protein